MQIFFPKPTTKAFRAVQFTGPESVAAINEMLKKYAPFHNVKIDDDSGYLIVSIMSKPSLGLAPTGWIICQGFNVWWEPNDAFCDGYQITPAEIQPLSWARSNDGDNGAVAASLTGFYRYFDRGFMSRKSDFILRIRRAGNQKREDVECVSEEDAINKANAIHQQIALTLFEF